MSKSISVADLMNSIRTLMSRKSDSGQFTCGDCHKNERCGAEPSPLCVVRAAQIERDAGQPRKRSILAS